MSAGDKFPVPPSKPLRSATVSDKRGGLNAEIDSSGLSTVMAVSLLTFNGADTRMPIDLPGAGGRATTPRSALVGGACKSRATTIWGASAASPKPQTKTITAAQKASDSDVLAPRWSARLGRGLIYPFSILLQ